MMNDFHFFTLAALSAITQPTGPAPIINKSGFLIKIFFHLSIFLIADKITPFLFTKKYF